MTSLGRADVARRDLRISTARQALETRRIPWPLARCFHLAGPDAEEPAEVVEPRERNVTATGGAGQPKVSLERPGVDATGSSGEGMPDEPHERLAQRRLRRRARGRLSEGEGKEKKDGRRSSRSDDEPRWEDLEGQLVRAKVKEGAAKTNEPLPDRRDRVTASAACAGRLGLQLNSTRGTLGESRASSRPLNPLEGRHCHPNWLSP